MTKKKSIRPTNNTGRENEIDFDTLEEYPTERLLGLIFTHQQKSVCDNCRWTFAIVDSKNLSKIKNFERPYLLIIHTELLFVQRPVQILLEKYSFVEELMFKPEIIDLMGAFLVYCDHVPQKTTP